MFLLRLDPKTTMILNIICIKNDNKNTRIQPSLTNTGSYTATATPSRTAVPFSTNTGVSKEVKVKVREKLQIL